MAGKRTQMFRAWLLWSVLLIVFGLTGSAIGFPWIAALPVIGLLIHAGIIASKR